MFSTKVILFAFAMATNVNSQTPKEINQTPACILNCVITAAAEVGCPLNIDNASCVCGSFQFQNSTSLCLQKYCTPDEIKLAATLDVQKCSTAALNSTGPTNGTSSTPGSLVGSSTAANSTSHSAASALVNNGIMVTLGTIAIGFLYV